MGGRHAATTHASPAFPILGKMNGGTERPNSFDATPVPSVKRKKNNPTEGWENGV